MLQVVVLTDSSLTEQQRIADFCHQSEIAVIIADTRGLFGYVVHHVSSLSSLSYVIDHHLRSGMLFNFGRVSLTVLYANFLKP